MAKLQPKETKAHFTRELLVQSIFGPDYIKVDPHSPMAIHIEAVRMYLTSKLIQTPNRQFKTVKAFLDAFGDESGCIRMAQAYIMIVGKPGENNGL